MATSTQSVDKKKLSPQLKKVILSGYLGSSIEYYDFLLYGVIASLGVFSKVFFVGAGDLGGLLASFATLAVGYIARPIGGMIFGHFGDKMGRKSMLVITMSLMGGVSVLIGLIPPAEMIGIAAPILLVTLRILQGIAVGGEWGGAALLALEHAPKGRRGFASSIANVGAATGTLLSTTIVLGVRTIMTDEQFFAWGWRIPFLFSALLVAVGLWVRLSVQESPLFKEMMDEAAKNKGEKTRSPLWVVVTKYPKAVAISAFSSVGAFVYLALMGTFALSMMTKNGVPIQDALMVQAVAAIVHVVSMPFFGALSDKVGRRAVILGGSAVGLVFAYPMLYAFSTGDTWLCLVALLVGNALVHSAIFGPLASFIAEMFGTGNRYSGASLGYQLGSTIGSGFAPLIAISILATGDGNNYPMVALFTAGMCLVSIVATYLAKESKEKDLGQTGKKDSSEHPAELATATR
ncbi:MFS family permease [Arthrobacter ginsengisoli]|uniref:MFS family permease n=1 Tax=Arthrobacter ginsengisoli TaxID=1356565 RepID=A0ABU1UGG3_9MICC|nr:MFS transporter [Arthrobacter ginsengisoli]MDR7084220.1 MFS family permease [Arthrobacter ginsengisoli]